MEEKLNEIELILDKFKIDKVIKDKLILEFNKEFKYYKKKAKDILDLEYEQGKDLIKEEGPSTILKLLLVLLPDLKKKYIKKGIKEDIFYNTISDIFLRMRIYKEKYSELGLTSTDGQWILLIFYLRIFKLGSLQFEMTRISLGNCSENVLSIHIMEGEDISPKKVDESLKYAKEFFKEYFNDFKYNYFYCWSWLLYSGNKEILNKDSNIIRFMERFHIIAERNDPNMAIERIYDRDTSLGKKAAENINSLGISAGIIEKSKV